MKNRSIELKWALIFSLMTLGWLFLEKISGLHDVYIDYHPYLTNLFMIPAVIIMVLALKNKKNTYYNGQITYKQALVSGAVLSLIIALLSPLTQLITSYVITPDYFATAIKRSVEIGYYKTAAEAEAVFNYPNYAIQGAIGALLMGVVTTAIIALFIRTRLHQRQHEVV